MWVMGCHLGEIGVGGTPERLWENEAKGNAASGGRWMEKGPVEERKRRGMPRGNGHQGQWEERK